MIMPTSGRWVPREMTMTKKAWAELNTGHPMAIVCRGVDVVAVVWAGDDREGEELANAWLLAASKDVLQALKDLRDAVRKEPAMQGRMHVNLGLQVQNAIDRAEGRHG